MWFLLQLRNSKDLLTLKVFGYSNFKIFFILAFTSFIFGWIILFAINPITSSMVKYYEQTKSKYSRDVDHLIVVNKNGLWIKENVNNINRIISADETKSNILKNVSIFNLDKNYNLLQKIHAATADISKNEWILNNVTINNFDDGISKKSLKISLEFNQITIMLKLQVFTEILMQCHFWIYCSITKKLQIKGYNKTYLDQNLNSLLSLPFFCF